MQKLNEGLLSCNKWIMDEMLQDKNPELKRQVRILKKQLGQYRTPKFIIDYILEQMELSPDKKVLDPACGTGDFLLRAYDILKAKYERQGVQAAEIHSRILKNNLYGVDINPFIAELAIINLVMKDLSTPVEKVNIIDANSLRRYELEFDYGKENSTIRNREPISRHAFFRQRFDVIIGNPPYLDGRNVCKIDHRYYKKVFRTAQGKLNTFSLFIERGLEMLKSGGRLGFIVPSTMLRNSRYWAVRLECLDRARIHKLTYLDNLPFKDAVVTGLIVILEKVDNKRLKTHWKVKTAIVRKNEELRSGLINYSFIDQRFFETNNKYRFYISLSNFDLNLLKKIKGSGIPLREICEVKDGISTGFKPFRDILLGYEADSNFVALNGETERFDPKIHKKVIDGQEFKRYSEINWKGRFIKYDKRIEQDPKPKEGRPFNCQLRDEYIFLRKKIITRQTADRLIGTLDTCQFYTRNSIHNTFLHPSQERNFELEYILGIINSRLMTWYYQKLTQEASRVFPQVHIMDLKELPIKRVDLEEQRKFVDLVNRIIKLNKELTLNHTHKKKEIQRKIEAIDRIIDKKIYDLYGLTRNERRLIEESCKNLK
ncbi:MAG: N-6 DNA methylase [bacterium]|nr:N-6 DNA methylase [bacterium]